MIDIQTRKVIQCFEKVTLQLKDHLEQIDSNRIREYVNIIFKYFNNELFGDYQGMIIMIKKELIKKNINIKFILSQIQIIEPDKVIEEQNDRKLFNLYFDILLNKKDIRDELYNSYKKNTDIKDRYIFKLLIIKLIKLINIYRI